jgi:hypothetical protein
VNRRGARTVMRETLDCPPDRGGCGARAGQACRTNTGRDTEELHAARWDFYLGRADVPVPPQALAVRTGRRKPKSRSVPTGRPHDSADFDGLTLADLQGFVHSFTGHIEDMTDADKLFTLGKFAGAVSRLRAVLRELYEQPDPEVARGPSGYRAALRDVARVVGESEGWPS